VEQVPFPSAPRSRDFGDPVVTGRWRLGSAGGDDLNLRPVDGEAGIDALDYIVRHLTRSRDFVRSGGEQFGWRHPVRDSSLHLMLLRVSGRSRGSSTTTRRRARTITIAAADRAPATDNQDVIGARSMFDHLDSSLRLPAILTTFCCCFWESLVGSTRWSTVLGFVTARRGLSSP